MSVLVQYNPSTMKAAYDPVTKKLQTASYCLPITDCTGFSYLPRHLYVNFSGIEVYTGCLKGIAPICHSVIMSEVEYPKSWKVRYEGNCVYSQILEEGNYIMDTWLDCTLDYYPPYFGPLCGEGYYRRFPPDDAPPTTTVTRVQIGVSDGKVGIGVVMYLQTVIRLAVLFRGTEVFDVSSCPPPEFKKGLTIYNTLSPHGYGHESFSLGQYGTARITLEREDLV